MRSAKIILLVGILVGAAAVGYRFGPRLLPSPVLRVTSVPSGAAVFVDGAFRGFTPLALPGLARGEHLVRVEADGHTAYHTRVSLTSEVVCEAVLTSVERGRLRVTADPAGATVILDGNVAGRAPLLLEALRPGRHTLEITATNYLPVIETLTVESGKDAEWSGHLKHRQVEAYHQRIAADPGDLGARNDLGELLFVLERYPEAAAAYVDAFEACEKYATRDHANRSTIGKLTKQVRQRRDRKGVFQKELNKAILAALLQKRMSSVLYGQFKKINYAKDLKAYLDAYEAIVTLHEENGRYVVDLMDFCRKINRFDRLQHSLQLLLARKTLRSDECKDALAVLVNAYQGPMRKNEKELDGLVKTVLAKLEPMKLSITEQAGVLYQKSRLANVRKQPEQRRQLLEQAVSLKVSNAGTLNTWRMELVNLYREEKAVEKAQALCAIVAKHPDKRHPAVKRAKVLIKSLTRETEKRKAARRKAEAEKKRKEEAAARKKAEVEKQRQKEVLLKKLQETKQRLEEEARQKAEAEMKTKTDEAPKTTPTKPE